MKITATQLRSIIKEEVSRALREASVEDHERPDEARSQLTLGMKRWLSNPEAGWPMITGALKDLMGLEGLSEDEAMDEVTMAADTAGFGDDDVMDIDSSVRDWLESGGV